MRVQLKGLSKATAVLATGERKTYWYAWRGGPRLHGEPGTPEFMRSYNEAVAQRKMPPKGLMLSLIAEFKRSAEFTTTSPASQKNYLRYLRLIEEAFGDLPIDALADPRMRGQFKEWRDTMADRPRTADYAWTTLARVLSVAKDRGRITVNPCERGGRLYEADRADKVWGEDEIKRVLELASPGLAHALVLAVWTGQRQSDLLRLLWSGYDGKRIKLRQGKGKRTVVVPVSSYLRAALDPLRVERRAALTSGPVAPIDIDGVLAQQNILLNSDGRPWTSDGFRTSWGKLCKKAGVRGLTFHDLRGSAVVRLALAGSTVPEIATVTGHSLKDVEDILDRHYLGRDVQLAESAIRKLEQHERKRTKTAKRTAKRSSDDPAISS